MSCISLSITHYLFLNERMDSVGFLIGALKIIIVLGTLITIHEAGHFFVAKACNVKVYKFAIGFGPKIFTKQGKETEYTLRLIPFGGFVQLDGEDGPSNDERAYNKRPIWQRILIVLAGATVNLIFALIVYFFISTSTNYYYSTTIKDVPKDSVEYVSGLRTGDKIIRINDKSVLVGYDIEEIIDDAKSDYFDFEIERDGGIKRLSLHIPVTKRGLLGVRYDKNKTIVGIVEDTPVYTSGIQSGDIILRINDISIEDWNQISSIIEKLPDSDVKIEILRNGEEVEISTKTFSNEARYYSLDFDIIHPKGFDVVKYALNETGDYFIATIKGIVSLFNGKAKNVKVMGIVGVAEQINSTSSFVEFFYLMSALSLSLGLFNLLPIPALDGGKILFLLIEKYRGKPMKQETETVITLIGFALITLLAIIITSKDIIGIINR